MPQQISLRCTGSGFFWDPVSPGPYQNMYQKANGCPRPKCHKCGLAAVCARAGKGSNDTAGWSECGPRSFTDRSSTFASTKGWLLARLLHCSETLGGCGARFKSTDAQFLRKQPKGIIAEFPGTLTHQECLSQAITDDLIDIWGSPMTFKYYSKSMGKLQTKWTTVEGSGI
jgi:hypothetical protein